MEINAFRELIWEKSRELYREMPWRTDTRPYYVLVSEIMLQQTQVSRVIEKFLQFTARFPDIESLAAAPLADVLELWSGLGYNRRARYLHVAAQNIVADYGGSIPDSFDQLVTLPGIGPNTAGAILVYSYNHPIVFIETNIRTVYFHHFFAGQSSVSDSELKEVVQATIDQEHPREFYWALMDYGAQLKKQGSAQLDKSRHYKKQPPLKGSVRQIRGLIVRCLTLEKELTIDQLHDRVPSDQRFQPALDGLIADGIIVSENGIVRFAST